MSILYSYRKALVIKLAIPLKRILCWLKKQFWFFKKHSWFLSKHFWFLNDIYFFINRKSFFLNEVISFLHGRHIFSKRKSMQFRFLYNILQNKRNILNNLRGLPVERM